jgi:hypothetical protein
MKCPSDFIDVGSVRLIGCSDGYCPCVVVGHRISDRPTLSGASDARLSKETAMSLSRKFAAFVAKLTYEDLPPEVVDRAKGVTLQALI